LDDQDESKPTVLPEPAAAAIPTYWGVVVFLAIAATVIGMLLAVSGIIANTNMIGAVLGAKETVNDTAPGILLVSFGAGLGYWLREQGAKRSG
jgi:hypothetical protein